jgi:anti-sigma B factor antagonist
MLFDVSAGVETMRIIERNVGDVTILELEGRLILGDEGEVPLRDWVNRLVDAKKTKILLDLRKVTRLDSAGVGMLVSKFLTAYHKGGRVKLLHLTNRADQLMKLTRLATVFEMFESEDEAIKSFEQPARSLPLK